MKNITVVVVDDALFMRKVLIKMLEDSEGITVVGEAENGLQAIEQAKLLKPDLLTLDITMPVMDGLKALPEIAKASPGTRVIMVSAMGQQAMVLEAITLGASDFIVKPFEKSRVMQAIRNSMVHA